MTNEEKIYDRHGVVCTVWYDDSPEDPINDWDVPGKFALFHGRYALGNCREEFKTPDDLHKWVRRHRKSIEFEFDVYMYDHSGIALSLWPFQCPWDSGQIGRVILKRSEVNRLVPKGTPKEERRKLAENYARGVLETYEQYLNGDVGGYTVEGDEVDEESCGGFYGFSNDIGDKDNQMIRAARDSIAQALWSVRKFRRKVVNEEGKEKKPPLEYFGNRVLEVLEMHEEWSADTLEEIARIAHDLGLSELDRYGMFRAKT